MHYSTSLADRTHKPAALPICSMIQRLRHCTILLGTRLARTRVASRSLIVRHSSPLTILNLPKRGPYQTSHNESDGERKTPKNAFILEQEFIEGQEWIQVTEDLLSKSQWEDYDQYMAEQCLGFWSKRRTPLKSQSNLILELWTRLEREMAEHTRAAAAYDFAVLALAKHGFVEESIPVFDAFMHIPFIRDSRYARHIANTYHLFAVLKALSESGQVQRAENILLEMLHEGPIQPNTFCLSAVVEGWRYEKQGQRAEAIFDYCTKLGVVEANTVCCVGVLRAWASDESKDAPQRAEQFFRRMPIKPDEYLWLAFFMAIRDPLKMEKLLWDAYRQGEAVNAYCFNVVVHAWGLSQKIEKAEDFTRRWIQYIADNPDTPPDYWPGLETINILINASAKLGDIAKVRYWMKQLTAMGFVPDQVTHCSYMDVLARKGMAHETEEEWLKVRDQLDEEHSVMGCHNVISAWGNYAKESPDKDRILKHVRGFVADMEKKGWMHNVVTLNVYLKVVKECQKPDLAEFILRRMEGSFIEPNHQSYVILIDAYAEAGNPVKSHQIHRSMPMPPNCITFNAVIKAFARCKDSTSAEVAEDVIVKTEMKEANVEPDLVTYCSLMTAWSNSEHPDRKRRAKWILDIIEATYQDWMSELPRAAMMAQGARLLYNGL